MVTNHNMRKRRQHRIKAILEQQRNENIDRSPPSFSNREAKWNDPEYVWKQQRRIQLQKEGHHSSFLVRHTFVAKLCLSFLIFVAIWGLFQIEEPWAVKGQDAIRQLMNTPLDFSEIQAWYASHFSGFPSLIPAMQLQGEDYPSKQVDSSRFNLLTSPAKGKVIQPYSVQHPGIKLAVNPPGEVTAIATGRIQFAGETTQTGLTIVVQHRDGLKSLYGKLDSLAVEKDDWVEAGTVIGYAAHEEEAHYLYFSLMQGDEWINPQEVMRFE